MQIIVLIDRSGSMSGKESDVKGGVKTFINEHRNMNAKVTLIQFDDKYEPIVSDHISHIDESVIDVYKPRGSTALRDAVAKAINETEETKVLFVIITDGQENASIEYGGDEGAAKLKKLIAAKESVGWKFIYMGANQDSFTSAQNLGISKGLSVNYTEEKTSGAFRGLAYVASNFESNSINYTELNSAVNGPIDYPTVPNTASTYVCTYTTGTSPKIGDKIIIGKGEIL